MVASGRRFTGKEIKGTFWDPRNVLYLDLGHGNTDTYLPKLTDLKTCVIYCEILCLNKKKERKAFWKNTIAKDQTRNMGKEKKKA